MEFDMPSAELTVSDICLSLQPSNGTACGKMLIGRASETQLAKVALITCGDSVLDVLGMVFDMPNAGLRVSDM